MSELIREATISAGLGAAVWLLSLVRPLRTFQARPELGWDLVAVVGASVFTWLAVRLLDPLTDWASLFIERWYEATDAASLWLIVPCYVALADLGAYWAHRAMHTRWLWPTHAWHHSARHLNWLAGLRGSPIHFLVLAIPYFLAFMLFPLPETALAGSALLALDAGNQHLIHSNLRLPFVRQLERVFVTPRFHFVHHNANIEIANSNYGFIFSFWDRLFRTYHDPATVPADAALGLAYEAAHWRLLLGVPQRK